MDAERPVENGTGEDVPTATSAMSKTTTISTIAVQSGATRIVIALLHVGVQTYLVDKIWFIYFYKNVFFSFIEN